MTKQLKVVPLYVVVSFVFLYVSTLLIRCAIAQDQISYLNSLCSKDQQYEQGSQYQNNLDLLLSNLTSEAITTRKRFYNVSTGEAPNKVYGLFLCNSLFTDQVCEACITLAQGEIQRRCPSSVDAIVWFTECMLRYANHPIFSVNDDSVYTHSESRIVKFNEFNQQLTKAFISLVNRATTGNSSLMSATTVVYLTTEISFNCYVECTPDLSPSDCNSCLRTAVGRLRTGGYQAGVLLQPSCRLMYSFVDVRSFTPGKKLYVALGVVSLVAGASFLSNAFVCLKRKKATRKPCIFANCPPSYET